MVTISCPPGRSAPSALRTWGSGLATATGVAGQSRTCRPACGEHLQHARFGAVEHAGQVADHGSGGVSQGQLDRQIQLLDDGAERAGHLEDHDITHGVRPDLLRAWGQAVRPMSRPPVADADAKMYRSVVRIPWCPSHGVLVSVVKAAQY